MLNDMMQKQGLTRSYALSLLRSKFESEERHQEVEYVEDLIRKEAEKQEQEFELPPTGTTATSTAAEEEEEVVTTNQPGATISTSTKEVSKISYPPQQQKQETLSSKLISKQLDKQTIQINKKIIQALQPLQKQSQLIRQLQSQLKQLQKQVSQIQRVVRIKKNKKR
jgi:maltodextrin utilization protein YvdJ